MVTSQRTFNAALGETVRPWRCFINHPGVALSLQSSLSKVLSSHTQQTLSHPHQQPPCAALKSRTAHSGSFNPVDSVSQRLPSVILRDDVVTSADGQLGSVRSIIPHLGGTPQTRPLGAVTTRGDINVTHKSDETFTLHRRGSSLRARPSRFRGNSHAGLFSRY